MKEVLLDLEFPSIDEFSILCHILVSHQIDFNVGKIICNCNPPCILYIGNKEDHPSYKGGYIDRSHSVFGGKISLFISQYTNGPKLGRIEILGTVLAHYLLGGDENCKFCVIDSSKARRKFNVKAS